MSSLRRPRMQVRPKVQAKNNEASAEERGETQNKTSVVEVNNVDKRDEKDKLAKTALEEGPTVDKAKADKSVRAASSLSEEKQSNETASESKWIPVVKSPVKSRRKQGRTKLPSDRTKMIMKDLLMYNPPSKKMKENPKDAEKEQDSDESEVQPEKEVEKEVQNKTEESCNDLAPRVKVGANGELILDEDSVVVKRKNSALDGPAIIENCKALTATATYSSYRRHSTGTNKPRWTECETARFYGALRLIGTDFTLMSKLFFNNSRSRLDLRNKYKKEERLHKFLIDEALKGGGPALELGMDFEAMLNEKDSDDSDNDD